MRFGDRSDADLMASAQAGWSPAFAVLLHRHGPAVRSAVHDEADPIAATRDVFLTALDELPRMDPQFPVRAWLLDIAGSDRVPDPIIPLREEERDAIWASLIAAWPGRPRPPRTGLRRAGLLAGLVVLSALVPTLVFLAGETPDPATQELRAHPVVGDDATTVDEPADEEPLPTFSFPSVSQDQPEPTPSDDPPPVISEPPGSVTEPDPTETDPETDPEPDPTDPGPDPTDPETDPEPEPTETDPEPDPTETEDPPLDPLPPIEPDPDADAEATGAP